MIVVDTTVLAYAVGGDHGRREPCRRVLRAHAEGRVEAATTIEAVQEFVHVRARRRSRADAVTIGRAYAAGLTLLAADPDDLELGLSLFEENSPLGAFDAVLAAIALNRRAEALVSADRAFANVPNLRWIDPSSQLTTLLDV